jgi:aspartyl-tRNA(Asn)/glutamyl-tRNA(Gln) amidotransferase subunit B
MTSKALSLASRGWEVVVGLEIHAQVMSHTKLFSQGFAGAGKAGSVCIPNSACALFDVAHPGTLPSLNRSCVAQAVRASAALQSRIHGYSLFERKHYLYPDLPHGFQITQLRYPIGSHGFLRFEVNDRRSSNVTARSCAARIARIQLETDSGKSVHGLCRDGSILLDFNRAGVALLEIVTQPDLRGSDEAVAFIRKMQVSAFI